MVYVEHLTSTPTPLPNLLPVINVQQGCKIEDRRAEINYICNVLNKEHAETDI